jgi:6-pyruvoyl-tetrahydropterin synthase
VEATRGRRRWGRGTDAGGIFSGIPTYLTHRITFQREVRERFDHSNINLDVAEFADGRVVPTGENLARFIAERVQGALGTSIQVTRVTVAEDATLSATYEPG